MFSAIRRNLNPAMVLAFVALVFAITGGAYAASGGSGSGNNGSGVNATAVVGHGGAVAAAKKKSSSKGARGPAGPKGATGAAGPAGGAGAAGPVGPTGPVGPAGAAGTAGAAGSNGTSVTSTALSAGSACAEGGSEFVAAGGSKTLACNGTKGKEGSIGNALPKGVTETGVWSIGPIVSTASSASPTQVFASFAIKLKTPLNPEQTCGTSAHLTQPCPVHYILEPEAEVSKKEWLENAEGEPEEVEASAACTGNFEEPTAESGNLCIYVQKEANLRPLGSQSITVSKVGATAEVFNFAKGPGDRLAYGSWAVTGE